MYVSAACHLKIVLSHLGISSSYPEVLDPGQQVSDNTISSIKKWIEKCVHNHEECHLQANSDQPESNEGLPTRLLDLAPSHGLDFVTLREKTEVNPRTQYTTLSHCWCVFLSLD